MTDLNQSELECLKKIASGESSEVLPVCPDCVLARLLSLGFIEYGPRLRLPLEMTRPTYKITSSGYKLLISP